MGSVIIPLGNPSAWDSFGKPASERSLLAQREPPENGADAHKRHEQHEQTAQRSTRGCRVLQDLKLE